MKEMVATGEKAVKQRMTNSTTYRTLTKNLLKEVEYEMLASFSRKVPKGTEARNHFISKQKLDVLKSLIASIVLITLIALIHYHLAHSGHNQCFHSSH